MAYRETPVRIERTASAGFTVPAPAPMDAPEPPDPCPSAGPPKPEDHLDVLVLQPAEQAAPLPGILWMHGGGYCLGGLHMLYESRVMPLVERGEAVVVAPDYRLAGQAPYPAAFEDCYHALLYMCRHADELGIRSDQLFVGGESAGGGLAVAVCMKARDTGDVKVAYQMPLYPMLDCLDTETSRNNDGHPWNTRMNHWAWPRYLGALAGSAPQDIPAYASPARQTDYAGLPPAYTFVCEGEPFFAETCTYVENLRAAGVEADMDIFPGSNHAFDLAHPESVQAQRAAATFEAHFRHAAANLFAPQ